MRLFRFLRRKSDLREELESHLKMAIADRVAKALAALADEIEREGRASWSTSA